MEYNIILGHGSRNPEANQVLIDITNMFQQQTETLTTYAFLQFQEPTLEQAIHEAANARATVINIIPFFLFPGVHIKEDVPQLLDKLTSKYDNLDFVMTNPIGRDSKLVEILQDRLNDEKERIKEHE